MTLKPVKNKITIKAYLQNLLQYAPGLRKTFALDIDFTNFLGTANTK